MTARLPDLAPLVSDAPVAVSRHAPALAAGHHGTGSTDAARRAVRLERAGSELRQGRPVGLWPTDPAAPALLVQAVETLDEAAYAASAHWPGARHLLLTAERHAALHHTDVDEDHWLPLPSTLGLAAVQAISGLTGPAGGAPAAAPAAGTWQPAPVQVQTLAAALQLAKWARLTPALLLAPLPALQAAQVLAEQDWLSAQVADVAQREREALPVLRRVSDGLIPLGEDGQHCTLILFREQDRDAEHVAVVYGEPDLSQPVPVRLHSSCLTGDLLGSLRCDCGEQLLGAAAQLQRSSGVLLYLAQEGRGTGLASKLRAYRLQDTGLDTLDADRYLGFRGDERDFGPAAAMLVALGIRRVALMTNNPDKIGALTRGGIEVVERLPLVSEPNPHNARYLSTKRDRAGHLSHDEQ